MVQAADSPVYDNKVSSAGFEWNLRDRSLNRPDAQITRKTEVMKTTQQNQSQLSKKSATRKEAQECRLPDFAGSQTAHEPRHAQTDAIGQRSVSALGCVDDLPGSNPENSDQAD